MVVFGASSGALVVYSSILLLDTLPSVRGAVMSLSAAGNSLGGAAGTALAGTLLAVQGYLAIYVGLGLVMPLMIACLVASFLTFRSVAGQDVEFAEVGGSDH
jgi:MFS family permease